jgi:hypothetical protein
VEKAVTAANSPYLREFGESSRSICAISETLSDRVTDNFWRTYTGVEIDIVEERAGGLYAYECKWGKPRARAPESFLAAYPRPHPVIHKVSDNQ